MLNDSNNIGWMLLEPDVYVRLHFTSKHRVLNAYAISGLLDGKSLHSSTKMNMFLIV